jgi:hypothetical protein
MQRVELLAERIELHRAGANASRTALHLEEELRELRNAPKRRSSTAAPDHAAKRARLPPGCAAEQMNEQRTAIIEQIRKLTSSQERTKQRQVQELERELREMRQYVAALGDERQGLTKES